MAEEIFTINLNYNGLYFNAQVDRETFLEVNKDTELLQRYTKQIYQQCFQQVGVADLEPSSPLKEIEVPSENVLRWNDKLTKLLIKERLVMEADLAHPKCCKIKLWQELAKKINKICTKVSSGIPPAETIGNSLVQKSAVTRDNLVVSDVTEETENSAVRKITIDKKRKNTGMSF
ncbi:unnamed protein product [Psylliodes chrysocephalus]|uniref:Uncharacterized protein n=1 Tax=Psylliodes chrysocephalus TaxID=3402493 RepID=A0A9P0GG68_9CUCU|nr:unnamed protein product [Psylliodes chrysocephala]